MKKKILIPIISGAAAVVLGLGALGGYTAWHYQQPKFHDLTIELGEPLPQVEEFLTQYADAKKAILATPAAQIDLSAAGEYQLSFTHGSKTETVCLTVTDTTAPVLRLKDVKADIGTELTPEDFVEDVSDLSPVKLDFAQPLDTPESYGDTAVEIIATDASGNVTRGSCTLSYAWIHNEVTIEFGSALTREDIFLNPEKDGDLISQETLDTINQSPAGTYPITVTTGSGQSATCQVTIADTTPPEVKVQDVTVFVGDELSLEDLLLEATDLAGPVTTKLLQELSTAEAGTYTVTVEATDLNGNQTTVNCTITVQADTEAPVFAGLTNISTEKGKKPNYTSGVSATDSRDGTVEFHYDASKVDLTKTGTYYVIYTAVDKAGNTATSRRKVVVENDQSDTQALVDQIAATLSDDVEEIRDYVRNKIKYSHDWGGNDPVWFGFTTKKGNCYVHALCLQVLLEAKGYETNLIWVTDKSHYWLQVNLDGVWKHIDATPGVRHTKYSLMNDEQRYECLQGRDWDRSQWPPCE